MQCETTLATTWEFTSGWKMVKGFLLIQLVKDSNGRKHCLITLESPLLMIDTQLELQEDVREREPLLNILPAYGNYSALKNISENARKL